MKNSNPDCANYISEDMCAASDHRPAEHCRDEEEGDCKSFVQKEEQQDEVTIEEQYEPIVSLDLDE